MRIKQSTIPGDPDDLVAGADLKGYSYDGYHLVGRNLRGVILTGTSLRGCDLRGADLTAASLIGCDLSSSDCTGADLSCADLSYANVDGADFTNANLYGVYGVTLANSYLKGATLKNTVLTGVHWKVGAAGAWYHRTPTGYVVNKRDGCLTVSEETLSNIAKESGCDIELVRKMYEQHQDTSVEGLLLIMAALSRAQETTLC